MLRKLLWAIEAGPPEEQVCGDLGERRHFVSGKEREKKKLAYSGVIKINHVLSLSIL